MPAHLKSALLGCELSLPIRDGRLLLGTWQGLYLGEHRNSGGGRNLLVTVQGAGEDDLG
jgi:secondary thiamine-phosphate synthase enzyme